MQENELLLRDESLAPKPRKVLRAVFLFAALIGLGSLIFVAGCFGMLALKVR